MLASLSAHPQLLSSRRRTMKTIVAASLIASAAAFAPASQKAASTAVTASFENEVGVQQPLGYWDTSIDGITALGLLADGSQEKFDRLRYVEVKHGRICMLAVVGYLTTEAGIRLPGLISTSQNLAFADIPGGFKALSTMPLGGIAQILLFVGWLELFGWKQAEGSFPGDFSASAFPVGFVGNYDEETKLKKRAIELNQGRAAQMGILALMVHEQLGVSILP